MKKYALLLLVGVLSLVLYLNPEEQNKPTDATEAKSQSLFDSTCSDHISRVKFIKEGASQELIFSDTLKSDDLLIKRSKWLLKEPFLAPANEEKVDQILTSIKQLRGEVDSSAPTSASQGQYGLVPPEGVLILECAGKEEVVSIGTKNEISGSRYYQIEGQEKLLLVSENFLESLIVLLSDIRAKKILAFDSAKIQGIEVVEGDSFYSLDKGINGDWLITSNSLKLEGDKAFIEKELKDLVNMNISRVFDNPLEILPLTGLEQPILILNLKIKINEEGPPSSLILQFGKGLLAEILNKDPDSLLGSNKQPYYLKVTKDNSIYELERSYLADWLQGASHFRLRSIFSSIDKATVTTASLTVGDLSCGLKGEKIVNSPELLDSFQKALNTISFDAFLDASDISKYEKAEGLKAQLQFGSRIISILKLADVKNQIDGKSETVAFVLEVSEVSEVGKETYYGTISSSEVTLIEDMFKDLCLKGKNG